MQAAQRKIGLDMIEGRFIETDDVGVAAFMIGVATGTFPILNAVDAAVKSLPLLDIGADRLMAVHAERALGDVVEHGVAFGAVIFDVRMGCDHRPRHHQPLHRLGATMGRPSDERQRERDDAESRCAEAGLTGRAHEAALNRHGQR